MSNFTAAMDKNTCSQGPSKKPEEESPAHIPEDLKNKSKKSKQSKQRSCETAVQPLKTTKKSTDEFKRKTLWVGIYAHGTQTVTDGILSSPDESDVAYPSRIEASLHHPDIHASNHDTAVLDKRTSGLQKWMKKVQSQNRNHVSLSCYSEDFRCPVVVEKKAHNLDKVCCLKMAIRVPRIEYEGRLVNSGATIEQYLDYHDSFAARCHNIRCLKLRYIVPCDQWVCNDLANTEIPFLYTDPEDQHKRVYFEKFLHYTTLFPALETITIQLIVERGLAQKKIEVVSEKIMEGEHKGEWTQIPTWPAQAGEMVVEDHLTTFNHLGYARTRQGLTRAQTGLQQSPPSAATSLSAGVDQLDISGESVAGLSRVPSHRRGATSPKPVEHSTVLPTRAYHRRC